MKYSFLYYVQLLMIGQVIQAMKVDQNAKKGPLSNQKMKCSFLDLHSTSDDRLCNPSNKSQLKCGKRPPKSLKNEILIFILHSTSDDWPSDPSNKS